MAFLELIDQWLWNPLFFLLVGAGIYLTIRLRGVQFRYLFKSLKEAFSKSDENSEGDISQFQALMIALAATIGIGNIAGVATAIAIGGVGAIFWLWVTAFVGMALKFGEALLAVEYRIQDAKKEMCGGPMYYIQKGLGWKGPALFFAFFGAVAAFFTGNIVQTNSIATAMYSCFGINPLYVGLALAIITGFVLIKGVKSIGKVTSFLVPIMALLYLIGCLVILVVHIQDIPLAISSILQSAFKGQAAIGGFAGSTVMLAMRMGVTRGIFSNESGLGSAPIAAAAAKGNNSGQQALISMSGAFLSTVVCSFTALAIVVTGVLGSLAPDGTLLNGAPLTMAAFDSVLPMGGWIVTLGSILFGYSTIVGWAYYGEKCAEYLLGERFVPGYRILYAAVSFIGVLMPLQLAWVLADIANAFMALPNLIGLVFLAGMIAKKKQSSLLELKQKPIKVQTALYGEKS